MLKNKKQILLIGFSVLLLLIVLIFALTFKTSAEKEREEQASLDAVSASIDGTVTAITGKTITISTSDGDSITFNMQKVELDCNSGVIPGNNVTLIYVGARNGTDTSNVRLRKIITTDDNSDLLSAKLEQTEEEDQEEENTTSTSSSPGYDKPGADVDVELTKENVTALYNVNVRADADGDAQVIGALDPDTTVTRTGICSNGWSRIEYEGQTGYVWGEYLEADESDSSSNSSDSSSSSDSKKSSSSSSKKSKKSSSSDN